MSDVTPLALSALFVIALYRLAKHLVEGLGYLHARQRARQRARLDDWRRERLRASRVTLPPTTRRASRAATPPPPPPTAGARARTGEHQL